MEQTFWDSHKFNSRSFDLNEEKEVLEILTPEDEAFVEFWNRSSEQDEVNWWSSELSQENSANTFNHF